MASGVKYSSTSARALAYLKRFYNDIDIFIEDVSCHNMALFLFRNILGSTIKLTSVNQLGGKTEVLKACRLDQANDGRRKLYVIDGDLDLLIGRPKPRLKNLYRLRAYCIENIVISDSAVLELATESDANTPPHLLVGKVDYPKWIATTSQTLLSLFILYAVARKLCPSVRTVSISVFSLCIDTPTGPVLSQAKIRAKMRSLCREMRGHLPLAEIVKTRKIVTAFAKDYKQADKVISGKDYLCPLLRTHLKSAVKFQGNVDDLKVRLARHYDPKSEPFLARRLRSVARL